VHVIRHDDETVEVKLQTIFSYAGVNDNCSRCRRQSPAKIGAESSEDNFEVWLKMRKTAAVFVGVHTERFSATAGP